MENQTSVPTQEQAPTPSNPVEKPTLKKYYIKMTCQTCNRPAVFFPQYKKVVCPSCLDITLQYQANNPQIYDYLPKTTLAQLAKQLEKSPYGLRYTNPRSDPQYGKPGRNEPCHCGSDEKYKECCLNNDMDMRNQAAKNLTQGQRDETLVAAANEFKLISEVFERMNTEELTELDMSTINFIPFKDITGTLDIPEPPKVEGQGFIDGVVQSFGAGEHEHVHGPECNHEVTP